MGKKTYKPKGTFIERELYESKAYLSLSGFAPQLLTLVLGKRQFDKQGRQGKEKRICRNCDSLNITYTEFFNHYGITQPRMTRAFDELLAKGFLAIVRPGGAFRQDKAVYALSTNWCIWQPGTVFETREKESVKRGFCNPKNKSRIRNRCPYTSTEPLPITAIKGNETVTIKKGKKWL